MDSILIWNVKGYNDNDLEMIFKGNKISKFTLLEVENMRTFENHSLQCDHFTIRETNIERIQNNNIKTTQMIVLDNKQLEYIGGNKINVGIVSFRDNPKLSISEQSFLNTKQVEI